MQEYNIDTLKFYKDFWMDFERVNEMVLDYDDNPELKGICHWKIFIKLLGYCKGVLYYGVDFSRLPNKDYDDYFAERRSLEAWLDGIEQVLIWGE